MELYNDEAFLQLSGLQHFAICRRQWALIHIENQWRENYRTVDGSLFHSRAHDGSQRERRGDMLILRDLPVASHTLGGSGRCDVVEFRADPAGVSLYGEDGLWRPFPVEYKRGEPKQNNADRLQLCAQAICLEEMLCCSVPEGALFYGETRRRVPVAFTEELRQEVRALFGEMHQLFRRGHTPKVKPSKTCNACSLKELCLPALMRKRDAAGYLRWAMEEDV